MRIRTLLLSFLVLLITGSLVIIAGPRDAQWKKVDEAIGKGLPKSAIEELQPIIDAALKEKAYPEAIKAITRKIALEGTIQGNKPQEKITRMEAEMAKAPAEMKPVMQALLAHWYWHYFQQNRWRFMQRTATAEAPGSDFTTWDLPRIFKEIDKHFVAALDAEKELRAIPVEKYQELLTKGTLSDAYRPTLYDFVAHEALAFYSAGEQAGAKAEDDFVLSADSPIFGATEDFLAWKIETTDDDSRIVKAIRLMQKLLAIHKDDQDPAAKLDVDLARLVFGWNTAFGEEKAARYKAALGRFADRQGDHEISARVRFQWASVLNGEGEPAAARDVAMVGKKAFPDSVGGRQCHNLIQQIEAKSANVSTERVWAEPWPSIDVRYRNITEMHFRLVKSDWVARLGAGRWRPEQLSQPDRGALLAQKPAREWTAKLPATEDFEERLESLSLPEDLSPGFYFLISSHTPDFGANNNQVNFTDVWVSKLALVIRSRLGEEKIEGFVLDSKTGDARPDAEVQVWHRMNNQQFAAADKVKTDKNGFFSVPGRQNASTMLLARHEDQTLAAGNDYYASRDGERQRGDERTIFFTDRSIYRPGQTIQYKGICIRVDQEADDYKTVADRKLTVVFADPNGKEISRREHATNDYGSFSGSFTAPRDRVTGSMLIRIDGKPHGATSVNVEEYKRPKFQVEVNAPKVPAKLNGAVTVQGKALGYTGAAIDGAKVKYRVVRETRYPIWWGWMYWWRAPNAGSQEIAHGATTTGTDGSFQVEFVAKPDPSVAEKDEPTFHYSVHADVTDSSGETRSGQRSVNIGYTALQATLGADEWQTDEQPVALTISTQTLDGEGQKAEGTLKVYRLKQPEKVVRPGLAGGYGPMPRGGRRGGRGDAARPAVVAPQEPKPDPSNPNSWELGEVVLEQGFTSDEKGAAKVDAKLGAGIYRAVLETQDRFGKRVTARLPLQVLKPTDPKFAIKIPNLVAAPKWSLEPGQEFQALWGSGYETARAFIEVEHRRKVVQAFWTEPGQTQALTKLPVVEGMRGGFSFRVTMVRENRAYLTSHHVDVPWSNKNLTVKWEHFVSKLGPAQKETWTAVVTGPDAKKSVAEMVVGLYDKSLDVFRPHDWISNFGVFRTDYSNVHWNFENNLHPLNYLHGQYPFDHKDETLTYRAFPPDLVANLMGYEMLARGRRMMAPGMALGGAPPEAAANRRGGFAEPQMAAMMADGAGFGRDAAKGAADRKSLREGEGVPTSTGEGPGAAGPDLSQVAARKNLNETAFFFPHLIADKDGQVKIEFTMPEALTEWKFLGFAHDRELRAGLLTDKVVTAKDLMVQPNPPRFLREGDVLEFTVKVSNQSATAQNGKVRLSLADARTAQSVDSAVGLTKPDQDFDIPAGESRSFAWRVTVPDGLGPITYKTVGSTGRLSDGEEGALPVLSRRVLVTESLPLPIRGMQTKKFDFEKLRKSGDSKTLKHQSLTVQMVSNPSWYAVMALPYLMEFPHECTEQTFNRFYANALARHVAQSDPKIRRVFDQWKGTPALDSPLEKNQDLKSVMIEETPWLRQANKESEARRNVGVLFDDNRLNDETERTLRKVAESQYPDGAWPWFPGGPANDYITLYITTGFGRMRHLGVMFDTAPALKSLGRLDGWIDETYRKIEKKDQNHLTSTIALYLYGRSFFLKDAPIPPNAKEAIDYYLGQARTHWLKLDNRQSQAHLAVALLRFGDKPAATGIMKSIKERSVSDEELGMFWRDTELSWWWYRAPIETQAMMIEAFDEVAGDKTAVEDCKVWLLKQKQTQDWKTSKATADAVYALLLRGDNQLASDVLVEVALGGQKIQPEKVEAGTGFYEQKFLRTEIKPQMGEITVKKTDPGVAWGSVHWQYLEDMTKVTPYEGTPLKLKKALFIKENTKKGPVLKPAAGEAAVGDELVVRVELRVDRDMEYVHLKDYRGSGVEPVNVLSRYRYQDGLGYYEATRDTASHFYIDYLPKGTYVFEYSTRVVHRGEYQTGMAEIQCMYAPEFNSHSESFTLKVK